MPVFQQIKTLKGSTLLVWKITEPLEVLRQNLQLTPSCEQRWKQMKSEMHQRAFLSVRQLLISANQDPLDLYYDTFGKPFLRNQTRISISHSHQFATIILNPQYGVGIDIEMKREKIKSIADKFVHPKEIEHHGTPFSIRELTWIWGTKESLYKYYSTPGLSFRNHIFITHIHTQDQTIEACTNFESIAESRNLHFFEFENFVGVYTD